MTSNNSNVTPITAENTASEARRPIQIQARASSGNSSRSQIKTSVATNRNYHNNANLQQIHKGSYTLEYSSYLIEKARLEKIRGYRSNKNQQVEKSAFAGNNVAGMTSDVPNVEGKLSENDGMNEGKDWSFLDPPTSINSDFNIGQQANVIPSNHSNTKEPTETGTFTKTYSTFDDKTSETKNVRQELLKEIRPSEECNDKLLEEKNDDNTTKEEIQLSKSKIEEMKELGSCKNDAKTEREKEDEKKKSVLITKLQDKQQEGVMQEPVSTNDGSNIIEQEVAVGGDISTDDQILDKGVIKLGNELAPNYSNNRKQQKLPGGAAKFYATEAPSQELMTKTAKLINNSGNHSEQMLSSAVTKVEIKELANRIELLQNLVEKQLQGKENEFKKIQKERATELDTHKNEMQPLKSENQKLKDELASCKLDAQTELNKMITEKVEAINKLQKEADAELDTHRKEMQTLKSEDQKLKDELASCKLDAQTDLNKMMTAKEEAINKLQKKADAELDTHKKEIQSLKSEKQKLKDELASCKDAAKTVHTNFDDQKAELRKMITEKVEAITKLEYDMKIENNRSTLVEKPLTATLQSVTDEKNDLKCTKTILEKKVKETEENIKLRMNEKYSLQNQIVAKQAHYHQELRRISQELTNTITENIKEKANRDSIIINLQHSLQEANKTIAKLNKNVEKTKNEAANLNSSLQEANNKIGNLEGELKATKNEVANLNSSLQEANNKITKLEENLNATKDEAADLKYYLVEANNKNVVEKNRSTSAEKQLKETLQSVTDEKNDLKVTKTILEKKVKETEQNVKLLMNENYSLQNQMGAKQTQYHQELKRITQELTNTITENIKDKGTRDSIIINLQHSLQEANKKIAKLSKNVEETENMAAQFKRSSEAANKKIEKLEDHLKTTEYEEANFKCSLEEANTKIAKLDTKTKLDKIATDKDVVVIDNLQDDINLEKTRTTTEQKMELQECENCGLQNQIIEKQTQCDPSKSETQQLLAHLTIILGEHKIDKKNNELKIAGLKKKLLDQKCRTKDLKHSLEEAKMAVGKLKQNIETTENKVKSIVDAVTSYSQNELNKLSTKILDHTRIITKDKIATVADRKRIDTPKAKIEILNNSQEEEQEADETTFTKKLHGFTARFNFISRQVKKYSKTTDPEQIKVCRKLLNGLIQDLNNARTCTHKKEKQEVKDNINLLLEQLNTFN